MSLAIELDAGAGEAVRFEGAVLHAVLPRAFAPGAPVPFRVTIDEATYTLRGKTIGSKRRPDGAYAVRMRLISLRKLEREALRLALST